MVMKQIKAVQVNGIPTRYLELGVEMPDDCPECDGGEYLGNRNLVEYLVGVKTVLIFNTWNIFVARWARQ